MKRLHFLLVYPLQTAPSQRFRFEQFFPVLEKENIPYSTSCFYDDRTFALLYARRSKLLLALRLLLCYMRRCFHMLQLSRYDVILIQRGAAPFGPPVFEWIVRYLYRKPIIYDFDDAIWRHPEGQVSAWMRLVKASRKTETICRWAHTVVVGNSFLAGYARRFAKRVVLIPTVVDTDHHFVPAPGNANPVCTIGWTGSHTTLAYLEALEPVLLQLEQQHPFRLVVIANKPPQFKKLDCTFIPWSEKSETEELRKVDIGIMPLPNDEWTRGKCGFKAIQYMALGKPAVVSDVGVNAEIVDHGVNGFVCRTLEEWQESLERLILDEGLRSRQGRAAREKITRSYSLTKAAKEWCAVLKAV